MRDSGGQVFPDRKKAGASILYFCFKVDRSLILDFNFFFTLLHFYNAFHIIILNV